MKVKPYLKFGAEDYAYAELTKELLVLFVNFPNVKFSTAHDVLDMDSNTCMPVWEQIAVDPAFRETNQIVKPPDWVLKKWKHGRNVVQRRAEAACKGRSRRTPKMENASGEPSRNDLRDRETEGRDALRLLCNIKTGDAHHVQQIAHIRLAIAVLPGHSTEDLRVALLCLQLPLDTQHVITFETTVGAIQYDDEVAPQFAVPAFTDVAYFLTLQTFCKSLWSASGVLSVKGPGKPTKQMYKDAMVALRFDSIQGSLGALAMRLCEASSGHAAPGQYGSGKKRRRRPPLEPQDPAVPT